MIFVTQLLPNMTYIYIYTIYCLHVIEGLARSSVLSVLRSTLVNKFCCMGNRNKFLNDYNDIGQSQLFGH